MELNLDACGITVKMKIDGYKKSSKEDWDDEWCNCSFSFSSGNWLNYYKENDEVLLSCEIEELESSLTNLLNDELKDVNEIRCIEPDFIFELHPKRDLRKDPRYIHVQKGYEIADIYVEWRIFFWNEGLTDNFLTITLRRNKIIELRDYFAKVIRKK